MDGMHTGIAQSSSSSSSSIINSSSRPGLKRNRTALGAPDTDTGMTMTGTGGEGGGIEDDSNAFFTGNDENNESFGYPSSAGAKERSTAAGDGPSSVDDMNGLSAIDAIATGVDGGSTMPQLDGNGNPVDPSLAGWQGRIDLVRRYVCACVRLSLSFSLSTSLYLSHTQTKPLSPSLSLSLSLSFSSCSYCCRLRCLVLLEVHLP